MRSTAEGAGEQDGVKKPEAPTDLAPAPENLTEVKLKIIIEKFQSLGIVLVIILWLLFIEQCLLGQEMIEHIT